ncbi:MAG: hypothetical protein QCI00_08285 [Candidatus Thermoplasmatota archaeon]|nr:hypothetical protein [Candidatus Thermoplasmatota archaeon]
MRYILIPNIQIDTDHGKKIVVLERTNNSVEMDFRLCRRYVRRFQGNSDVEEVIQREGVRLSLLLNMNVSRYVKIVYGSWDCMGKRFSMVAEKALERADLLLQCYNP